MTRQIPPVLGFVAPSGTGKTTLLRKLLPLLAKRGLRVGCLKHAHHSFDLDTPGKDSWELREAGAVQTLLASSERWALQAENEEKGVDPSLERMLGRFDARALDLILVEGFKHAAYPKLEVHRADTGKAPLYPHDPDILAVITEDPLPGDDHPPELPLGEPERVVDFILRRMEEGRLSRADRRAALVRHYRWLRRYGYNDSHSGNASVRGPDGFWVTPSGACADTLTAGDLVPCPLEGDPPQGASLDAPLHREVYRRNPEAGAVLHSHGPYSVAMSFAGRDFEPVDFEAQHYFESVPVLSIPYEDYVEKAPVEVGAALADYRVVMVRGHGVYARGTDLEQAYQWTTSLELSAKTYVIARQAAAI